MIEFYAVTGNKDLNEVKFTDSYGYNFEGDMGKCINMAEDEDSTAEFEVIGVSKTNTVTDVEYWGTNGLSDGSPYSYIEKNKIAAFLIKTVLNEKGAVVKQETIDFADCLNYKAISESIKKEIEEKYFNKNVVINEADTEIKDCIAKHLQDYTDFVEDNWDDDEDTITVDNVIKFENLQDFQDLPSYPVLRTVYRKADAGVGTMLSVEII